MSQPLSPLTTIRRSICQPILWLLVVAVMVYGTSAAVVGILGPSHVHMTAARDSAAGQSITEVFRAVRAWRAELRHRLLPADHAHGPRSQDHILQDHVLQADSGHHHDAWQRHHHEPQDRSVLALDNSAGPDATNPASSGSATLPLALAQPPDVVCHAHMAAARAWVPAAAARWSDAPQHTVHPPPRA
jgi:hypothetical protein